MAQVDASIYSNIQAIDPMGSYQKGLDMKSLANERAYRQKAMMEQEQMKQAYSSGMTPGPNGGVQFDQAKTIGAIAKVNRREAFKVQQQFKQAELAKQDANFKRMRQQLDVNSNLLGGVKDQDTLNKAIKTMNSLGMPTDKVNKVYDAEEIKFLKQSNLTSKDRLNQEWKSKEFGLKRESLDATKDYRAKSLKIAERKSKSGIVGGLSEGEKSADKDYGKLYNKYVSTGRNNAVNTIQKLEKLQKEVEKDTGFGEAGGTRFPIPDMFRSRLAIERRDDARNFANKTLKELFGGQLSDAEREAAAREYWNDDLDNESNAIRLKGKIKELIDNVKAQDAQAKHYQQNRTLKGFRYSNIEDNQGKPQTIIQNGHTYNLNPETGAYE